MTKWNLIFDVARCNNCNNCVLATKDEYLGNRFDGYSEPAPKLGDLWLTLKRHERGAAPMIDVSHYIETCQQCDDAPCINDATRDAISKRPDGIVVIDLEKAKGRKDFVQACPYGQIFWNEEQDLPQKWSFDAHLLDAGWAEPRCSQACPTQALTTVRLNDAEMARKAQAEGLVNLHPELGTKPRIWYRNFDRVTHAFLGGTVVTMSDNSEDCAEGVTVELSRDGAVVSTCLTDAFGDFKFEPLEAGGESYRLRILAKDGTELAIRDAPLETSRHIGVIAISSQ
ncbi:4Fe-4S dicluster domain-containing protein [Altererythrobacter sp.]|uniref:4Fe-4S dicluster domain-containing protein n=1 Tax=Altererythrobacter sp. TaxID=1872480 RepID=UPI003D0B082D